MLIGNWNSSDLLKVIIHTTIIRLVFWEKYNAESFISSRSSLSILAYHNVM